MNFNIVQLKKMLAAEQAQPNEKKYGAQLAHWAGTSKPVNIDEKAIKCLIRHYENRQKKN